LKTRRTFVGKGHYLFCIVFLLCLCLSCCQFLWIVHSWYSVFSNVYLPLKKETLIISIKSSCLKTRRTFVGKGHYLFCCWNFKLRYPRWYIRTLCSLPESEVEVTRYKIDNVPYQQKFFVFSNMKISLISIHFPNKKYTLISLLCKQCSVRLKFTSDIIYFVVEILNCDIRVDILEHCVHYLNQRLKWLDSWSKFYLPREHQIKVIPGTKFYISYLLPLTFSRKIIIILNIWFLHIQTLCACNLLYYDRDIRPLSDVLVASRILIG
jgi:hypothetical protein